MNVSPGNNTPPRRPPENKGSIRASRLGQFHLYFIVVGGARDRARDLNGVFITVGQACQVFQINAVPVLTTAGDANDFDTVFFPDGQRRFTGPLQPCRAFERVAGTFILDFIVIRQRIRDGRRRRYGNPGDNDAFDGEVVG